MKRLRLRRGWLTDGVGHWPEWMILVRRFAPDSLLEGNGFELQFLVARLSTVMGDGPAVPRSEAARHDTPPESATARACARNRARTTSRSAPVNQ